MRCAVWFPSYWIARYFDPMRYWRVRSAAAMWSGEGFCRNSDSFETALEISGLEMMAAKFRLPTFYWYP